MGEYKTFSSSITKFLYYCVASIIILLIPDFFSKLICDVDGTDTDGILVGYTLYWVHDEIGVCRVDVEQMKSILKYLDWGGKKVEKE